MYTNSLRFTTLQHFLSENEIIKGNNVHESNTYIKTNNTYIYIHWVTNSLQPVVDSADLVQQVFLDATHLFKSLSTACRSLCNLRLRGPSEPDGRERAVRAWWPREDRQSLMAERGPSERGPSEPNGRESTVRAWCVEVLGIWLHSTTRNYVSSPFVGMMKFAFLYHSL